jgi:hypothetical protein
MSVPSNLKPETHGPSATDTPARAPPPRALECADCHRSFADRSVTQWDVHVEDKIYITVCSACFEKRDQESSRTKKRKSG